MSKKTAALFSAVLIFSFLLRLPFLNREFVLEETLHVKVVRAIMQTGYPVVYLGQQQPLTIFMDRSPLLFFLFVPGFKLFGESEITARIVPVFFSILEIFLLMYFSLRLFKNRPYLKAAGAGLILAVNPYSIQTSLQIHFDGIFSFFSTFFILLCLDGIINKKKSIVLTGLVFGLAFGIKYEASLIALVIVIICGLIFNKRFLKKLIISVLASTLVFQCLFYIYNVYFGHPEQSLVPINRILLVINKIFLPKYTTLEVSPKTRSFWADNYYLLIRFLSWLSIPVIWLTGFSYLCVLKIKQFKKDPVIICLLIWFFVYCAVYLLGGWAGDYPRYFAPSLPALALLVSSVSIEIFSTFKRKPSLKLLLASVLAGLVLFLAAQNLNLLFLDHITGWIPRLQIPFFAVLLSGGIIISLVVLNNQSKKILLSLSLLLLTLALSQNLAQYIHDLNSNYSLTNYYSVSGTKEAGIFLKNHFSKKDAVIYTYDPGGYYYEGRYFDHYQLGPHPEKYHLILEAFQNGKIQAIALPAISKDDLSRILSANGFSLDNYLQRNFKNHKKFGQKLQTEIWY